MIRFSQISKSYKGRSAVEDLNLEISQGEHFILLGESGSGKTTSLKMVNRLIEPDSGQLLVGGKDILATDKATLRKSIGYVMQYYGLFPHFTVAENIAVVPQLSGWKKDRIQKRAAELLEIFSLEPGRYLPKYPHELSGGQQQRVGMIRALMASPPLLLMDEPLGALDPVTRISIQKEFSTLEELKEKTILMVTHDIQEAFILADRIGLMYQGRLIQTGRPIDFLINPASDIVKGFFQDQHFNLMLQCLTLNDLFAGEESLSMETTLELQGIKKIKVKPMTRASEMLECFSKSETAELHFQWSSDNSQRHFSLTETILLRRLFDHIKKLRLAIPASGKITTTPHHPGI